MSDSPLPDVNSLPLGEELRALIDGARREAVALDHEYVGSEHLVLALGRQRSDATLLRALHVDPSRIDAAITGIIQRGQPRAAPVVERPFTSRTRQAFAFASETARELGHAEIGVPEIVVGLMRERLNIGAQVLADHGLTVERAYELARGHRPPS